MEEKRICPECGKEYSSRPALSRKDNKTMICPKCGMMEALDTVRDFYAPGMTDQHWKQYKEEFMLIYILVFCFGFLFWWVTEIAVSEL